MVRWHDLIQFLRCVSKIHLSEKDKEFIFRFSQKKVRWEGVGALAEMNGVSGLLFYHLKHLGLCGTLPTSFRASIERAYSQSKRRTIDIVVEAGKLSKVLERAGIAVIALQGLSLLSIYGDPGLRYLDDVDLMVTQDHKEQIKALLMDDGFKCPFPVYPDILYRDGLKIDIHTHVLNLDRIGTRSYLFPEDLTPMWERAIPFSDQSDGLLLLGPSDNFIALAAHALKHSYSRLIWLSDLHEFLLQWTAKPNSWEKMVDSAQFWEQEKVVLYALILMERIFSLRVPFWVKSGLGIQKLSIFERYLLRLKARGFSSNELCIWLWLCNIKGAGKKLKFIKETLFPKNEVMSQIFPYISRRTRISAFSKRIQQILSLFMVNLHRAFTASLRSRR